MKPRYLIEISGIVLLLAIIGLGYRYAPDLLQRSDIIMSVSDCDPARRACQVTLPDGAKLDFRLSPQPVPLVKPFQVEVRVEGIVPRQLEVDFAALGMDMGYNRPRLKAGEAGQYVANTSLPVCITGPMQWQATVMLETLTARIAIPFRFSTSS